MNSFNWGVVNNVGSSSGYLKYLDTVETTYLSTQLSGNFAGDSQSVYSKKLGRYLFATDDNYVYCSDDGVVVYESSPIPTSRYYITWVGWDNINDRFLALSLNGQMFQSTTGDSPWTGVSSLNVRMGAAEPMFNQYNEKLNIVLLSDYYGQKPEIYVMTPEGVKIALVTNTGLAKVGYIEKCYRSDGFILFGFDALGVMSFVRSNDGITWSTVSALPASLTDYYIRSYFNIGNTEYLSVVDNTTNTSILYKSTDGLATVTDITSTLPDLNNPFRHAQWCDKTKTALIFSERIWGDLSKTVYVGVSPDMEVFERVDFYSNGNTQTLLREPTGLLVTYVREGTFGDWKVYTSP